MKTATPRPHGAQSRGDESWDVSLYYPVIYSSLFSISDGIVLLFKSEILVVFTYETLDNCYSKCSVHHEIHNSFLITVYLDIQF